MPHSTQCLVHIFHDLWRRLSPAELKQFLPNVAGIYYKSTLKCQLAEIWDRDFTSVNNGFGDASKKLADHCSLKILWNTVEGLLDNMASKSIHAKIQCITANSTGNPIDLLRGTVFEAALYKEISKSIDH